MKIVNKTVVKAGKDVKAYGGHGFYGVVRNGEAQVRVSIAAGAEVEVRDTNKIGSGYLPKWVWEKAKLKPVFKDALNKKQLVVVGEKKAAEAPSE